MKAITIILAISLTSPAWAAKRPGTSPEAEIRAERSSRGSSAISQKVSEVNSFLRDTMRLTSERAEIKTPEKMTEKEQASFVAKLGEFRTALENNSAKYKTAEARNSLELLISSVNSAIAVRGTFKDAIEVLKGDEVAIKNAQDIIRLIDNGVKVMEAKVSETGEAFVSEGLIMLTFSQVAKSLSSTTNPKLLAKELFEMKKQLEEPFKNENWKLEDLAGCR